MGERWRIGTAVFEVASVRTPCNDFKTWMGRCGYDNTAWVKRFTARRPARPLPAGAPAEGVLRAGDPIEVVHRPGHGVTGRTMFRGARPPAGAAARAAAASTGWSRRRGNGPRSTPPRWPDPARVPRTGAGRLPVRNPCELGYSRTCAGTRPVPTVERRSSNAAITDTSFVDTMTPNFAVQFLDRVAKSPTPRPTATPRGGDWESVTWQQAGDRVTGSRPACSRWASSPSSASASRRAPATSGSSPTSRSCAPAAPRPRSTPRRTTEDTAYILSDSECRVVFAEDDEQIAKLVEQQGRAAAPAQGGHLRRQRPTATGSSPWTTSPSSATTTSPSTPTPSRRPPRRSSPTSWPR